MLSEIKIPRVCQIANKSSKQLHTFADASKDAFATVVYLRTEYEGKIEVQLMQAKSRVAPIAKATIPRLELMGCLIGARLSRSVSDAMNGENIPSFFWSDSTTAIAWIQRNNEWGTFVGNRVKRILQTTEGKQWRYVPGALNPADLPSRGCGPKDLLTSRWWEGPDWLKLSEENWPSHKSEVNEEEINSEKKKNLSTSLYAVEEKGWFSTKYLSYMKNVRVMAWIRRFCNNVQKKKQDRSHLTIKELRNAELDIIKIIQAESKIKLDKDMNQKLTMTTINDDGIMRLKTPITKRTDTETFRYPYLMPQTHPMVRELIKEAHVQYCHAGSQFLMTKLREKYWITQSRKSIASVIHGCKRCQRFTSKKMEVVPAALPVVRVTSGEIFDTTGVDLFGYLTLKNGTKVWVVLYTCAVYRAIHLEVITSLSTSVFVKSLKRFVCQYGRPTTMMSDNGTNFHGTANLFERINKEELKQECDVNMIQWNFIPPASPWWGGFWERLVRSVKEPLRKMLGKSVVTHEQLEELLMDIQVVINDRPLTTVTEDPDDLNALTPAMFLRGTKDATFPEGEEISKTSLQNQWKEMKDLNRRLQARFRKEYLGQLVEHKKTGKQTQLQVGDIVLVGADNKKRYLWPMGRIEEILPSPDEETRVVRVKTKKGCLIRSLQRLYPLEMSNSRPEILNNTKREDKFSDGCTKSKAHVQDPKEDVVTRSGRKTKKPNRYGVWNQ